jgi:hypothetical protein
MGTTKLNPPTLTLTLSPGLRSALEMEALRRGVSPRRLVERVLFRYLPEYAREAVQAALAADAAPDRGRMS